MAEARIRGTILVILTTVILVLLFMVDISIPVRLIIGILSMLVLITGLKFLFYNPLTRLDFKKIEMQANKIKTEVKPAIPPMMIVYSGIDGAGKTTQLAILASKLKERNLKYKYLWFRLATYISLPYILFVRFLTRHTNFTDNHKLLPFIKLKYYLIVIDMFIRSLFRIKIPMYKGYFILCDRFVIDTIVDMIIEANSIVDFKKLIKLYLLLIPERSINIIIDVSEYSAIKRKNDITDIEYLRKRRRLYYKLAIILGLKLIDGEQKPSLVYKEIQKKVLLHYPFWYSRNINRDGGST